ncbi:sodium:calcium antiporter [Candidatus Woesearchaeota archaeon]|nr:MAG: sodium:calcium antiporter [Candidatus Woesearchaeota archaeon]
MILELFFLIAGIFFLVKGADLLIEGASSLARKLGVSELIVGLTIVSLGTSLPELMVNIFAAFEGSSDLAFGNVIGSNLANTLLVLGVGAIIYSISVKQDTVFKEIPFNILAVVALATLANDAYIDHITPSQLSRIDGIMLLLFFGIFVYYLFEIARSSRVPSLDGVSATFTKLLTQIGIGAIGLFIGGEWVVDGAIYVAKTLGVSEFLISATIVAFGTSLPELVTTIVSAMKKNVDILVGNIIGSNILNIFLILGLTAVIKPVLLPAQITFDILFLLVSTFLFFFLLLGKGARLRRKHGIIFVLSYLFYVGFIVMRG